MDKKVIRGVPIWKFWLLSISNIFISNCANINSRTDIYLRILCNASLIYIIILCVLHRMMNYLRYSLKATSHSSPRLSHEYTRACYLPFRVIKPAAQKPLHTRFRMKVFIKEYYFIKNTTLQSIIPY